MEKFKFTLFWRDGRREVVEGNTIADAFHLAGYGSGALKALDFYDHGVNTNWEWNAPRREWKKTD